MPSFLGDAGPEPTDTPRFDVDIDVGPAGELVISTVDDADNVYARLVIQAGLEVAVGHEEGNATITARHADTDAVTMFVGVTFYPPRTEQEDTTP